MKAIFTKALVGLALIAMGSAAGIASAKDRDMPRVEVTKVHYEHRGWDRHDHRFERDRRFFKHRHHGRFHRDHGKYGRFGRDHDDHGRFGRDRGHRG